MWRILTRDGQEVVYCAEWCHRKERYAAKLSPVRISKSLQLPLHRACQQLRVRVHLCHLCMGIGLIVVCPWQTLSTRPASVCVCVCRHLAACQLPELFDRPAALVIGAKGALSAPLPTHERDAELLGKTQHTPTHTHTNRWAHTEAQTIATLALQRIASCKSATVFEERKTNVCMCVCVCVCIQMSSCPRCVRLMGVCLSQWRPPLAYWSSHCYWTSSGHEKSE